MNKKILIGVFVVLTLILVGGAVWYIKSSNKNEGYDYYAKAEEYMSDKRYSEALLEYRKAINNENSKPDAYLKASSIYVLKNRSDEALALLDEASKHTKDKGIRTERAKIYSDIKKDYTKALDAYLETGNSDMTLAKLYIKNQNIDEANKVLEGINEGSNDYELSRLLLALANFNDFKKASDFISGSQLEFDKDYGKAIKELNTVLKEGIEKGENSKVSTLTKIGYIALNNGYPELSIPIYKSVTALLDEYWAGHFYLGVSYLRVNDFENSEKELKVTLERDGNQYEPYAYLGQLYVLKNIEKDSLDMYEKATSLKSDDENLSYEYANALVKYGLFTKAELIYKNLANYTNSENWIKYRIELADLYLNDLKDYDKANKVLEDLIDEWKGFDALNDVVKARIYDYYGWSFYKLENVEKTQVTLTKAYEFDKYSADINYHLGVIFRETKDLETSRKYLERAIDLDTVGEVSVDARKEIEKI